MEFCNDSEDAWCGPPSKEIPAPPGSTWVMIPNSNGIKCSKPAIGAYDCEGKVYPYCSDDCALLFG